MTTVYIIDNNSGGLRYNNRWKYVVDEIKKWGFECKLVDGYRAQSKKLLPQFSFFNSSDISKQLGDLFTRNFVEPNDIFIFPDARDSNAILLHEYRILHDFPIVLMGFWIDGVFQAETELRIKLRGKNRLWSRKWERCLVECYDYNLVTSDINYQKFKNFYNGVRDNEILKCCLPFDNNRQLIESILNHGDYIKDDLIIMNTNKESIHDSRIFEMLSNDYPNYQFVNFNEHNTPEIEYYRLLSKAKVLISTNKTDTNPYSIFESMVMGAIPILPDIPIYREYFGDRWVYDISVLKKPYLNFLRNRKIIDEKVMEFVENYLFYNIEETVKQIEEKNFNSSDLKNIICQLH